jgi:GNAT superfamily N-acetyltransferase
MTTSPFEPPAPFEVRRGDYLISTDPARLDLDSIYGYLSGSYWAAGRPREVVARSLRASLCFGLYHGASQVGLARVVTDCATFAWLCDVFVLEEHRGRGLGVWLIDVVVGHPELQGLRRIMLATRDAHGLYARHGFTPITAPERWMERLATASSRPTPGEETTP